MRNMTSQPYYVPLSPSYSLSVSEDGLSTGSSSLHSLQHGKRESGDPVSDFLADRLRIIEATIRQVLDEIAERERLHETTLKAIDEEEMLHKERLFQAAPHGSSVFTSGDPRRRAAIESELAALQKERRRELLTKFSDVGRLRGELRELLAEYWQEARRSRLIQK